MKLPASPNKPLKHSPLTLVAAQINYEDVTQDVAHSDARALQKLVGTEWTSLRSAPLMTTNLTPVGAVNQPTRAAYQLATADSSWSIRVNPSSVTLETKSYKGWVDFNARLVLLAKAVSTVFDPSSNQRLGLRYIDEIPLPSGESEWKGLIPDALLNPGLMDLLGDSLLGSDQSMLLQITDGVRCVFRHGPLADEGGTVGSKYLLDFDVFLDSPRAFDAADIETSADLLHDSAAGLFRLSITDTLYAALGG